MTRDLTTGSVWKHIIFLAIPSFLSVAIQQIYSLVDTVIVGRVLGEDALAGVGATGGLFFMIVYFCFGCCNGFSIPISQAFGAKNEHTLRKYFGNSIWLSLIMAAVVSVLMCCICPALLHLMKTPENIFSYSYDYIMIIFIGLIFSVYYNLLASVIRSLGDTRTPLVALIISSIINIGLDYFLTAVLKLGVAGAALATVLSQAIAGTYCLIILIKRFDIVHPTKKDLKLEGIYVKKLCGMGIPMGLQSSITGIGILIAQAAVNSLGSAAVAGMAVNLKIVNILNSPIDGLGQMMGPYAGQNMGAGQYARIKEGLFKAALAGSLWSLLEIPIVLLFGRKLVHLFLADPTPEVIEYAFTAMMFVVCFGIFLTLVNTIRFTIQGMGYSSFAMIAGIMEMIGRAAAALILTPLFGFTGAAMGNSLAWILADAFLIPAFFLCYRKHAEKKQ